MPQNISGFGLQVQLIATITFPFGISITQFADDADPLDLSNMDIAEASMGLNGTLIDWSKAVYVPCSLSLIPGSDDDDNLSTLFSANRVGAGKVSVRDNIIMTLNYPDGSIANLTNGIILNGPPLKSVGSAGRYKSKTYGFAFENYIVS